MRVLELGLAGVLVAAVLVFGGTEPYLFTWIQVALLGLAVVLVTKEGRRLRGLSRLTVAIPLALIAVAVVQILPLPAAFVARVRGGLGPEPLTGWVTISIAPGETVSHLLLLLSYLAAFFLALTVATEAERRRRLLLALLGLAAVEAFYGLFQFLTGGNRIYTFENPFAHNRATGTYINPNHLAGLLALVLPLALSLAVASRDTVRRTRRRSGWLLDAEQSGSQRLLLLALATVLFLALVFSQSRMGIFSAVLGSLLVLGLMWRQAGQRSTTALAAGVFVTAVALVGAWIGLEPVQARFAAIEQQVALAGEGRWTIWQGTARLIAASPWLGTGLGTFPIAYTAAQPLKLGGFVNHAHNDYLEVASDLGIPVALVFWGTLVAVLVRLIVRGQQIAEPGRWALAAGVSGSLVAWLCFSLTDFNLFIPANALLLAILLGVAVRIAPDRTELVQEPSG